MYLEWDTLETLLAPALFCWSGRDAVITPVRREFSEHLLNHLPQRSLLPQFTAALHKEKHYLSDPKTLKFFKRGVLILFYESHRGKGLGAVIAIARTRQAYLKAEEALESSDLDPSVLDPISLARIGSSKMKTVTIFDNVFRFPKPVSLRFLKDIGCGRPNDLISTRPINGEQLCKVLSEAMICA